MTAAAAGHGERRRPTLSVPPLLAAEGQVFSALRKEGEAHAAGTHRPFLLDDPESVWVVAAGEVDVFSVGLHDGDAAERQHLFSARPGDLVLGVGSIDTGGQRLTLLGVAAPGSMIRRVPRGRLRELAEREPAQVAALVERWVLALAGGLTGERRPRGYEEARPGEQTSLAAGTCVSSPQRPVWIEHAAGASHLFGDEELPLIGPGTVFPLAERAWLETATEARVDALDTEAYLRRDPGAAGLAAFHDVALHHLAAQRFRARAAERERLAALAESERAALSATLAGLAGVLDERAAVATAGDSAPPLVLACQRVLAAMGVSAPPAPAPQAAGVARDPVLVIAGAVRLRVRQVMLRGAWWRGDHGPLLAYQGTERRRVALLPSAPGRYLLYGTDGEAPVAVGRAVAEGLAPFAHMFYRRLPDRLTGAADLLRFGLFGCGRDLYTIAAMGLFGGLLALVAPLCTGILFDAVIPGAQRLQLLQLCLGLLLATVATSAFELASGFAVLRVEGRMSASLHAAVWDRVLDLPARFFRGYSAGDLTMRANGMQVITKGLSALAVSTIMSSAFGLCNAGLLLHYDGRLFGLALLLVGFAIAFALVAGLRQLRVQGPLAMLSGYIDGLVFQLINGMGKLRIAGAEGRAFTCWARIFGEQRRLALRMRAPLQVFTSIYPLLSAIVLYWAVSESDAGGLLSTGRFVAFLASFESFLLAALMVCQAWLSLVLLRMSYTRLRPILEALPEVDGSKGDPGVLGGEIEISHVSFRYADDGPLILDDVSLHIRPGELLAITGGSGSGKSTLLRLLLGFDRPTGGAVYYSGQDLSGLDLRAVRRQIGVVLQDGKLMADDIYSNIVGSSTLTREDAMEAARMAGLDRDLEQMPMGLNTLVSEGGSTLSGGQRQRLLIARALVRRPRILFFDEATSALDNQTQAVVSGSIEKLSATRVVIAHRLSTIMRADRIIVLAGGRVVQAGTYDELLRQGGPFAELARRQLSGAARGDP